MTTLKDQYEARGLGEFVHEGLPEFQAENLARKGGQDEENPGPETPSDQAIAWRKFARVCRDILCEKWTPYLAAWDAEETEEFKDRKRNSIYGAVNFYEEAVCGLVDKAFSKSLLLVGAEAKIEAFWGTASETGNVERRKRVPVDGDQFSRTAAETSLGYGGTPVILIDHPPLPQDRFGNSVRVESAADEDERGLGPFFVLINAWNILDADEDEDGNLDTFRYRSDIKETDSENPYKKATVRRVVELHRGPPGGVAFRRVFVKREKDKEYQRDATQDGEFQPPATASSEIKARFREIPIVPIPSGVRGWFAPPILRNVANLNISHYRKTTDYDIGTSVSTVSMGAFFGVTEEDMQTLAWGNTRVWWTSKPPSDAGYQDISFGFETSENARKDLERVERSISVKAKNPQSQRATGEEKSTIRLLDEAKVRSRLQAWAMGWLLSLQEALNWAGAWLGIEESAVGRLSYLPEVFEALSTSPAWSDYTGWIQTALDLDPALLPFHIREGKRHGVINDDEDTEELLRDIEAARAGGGLEDDDEPNAE